MGGMAEKLEQARQQHQPLIKSNNTRNKKVNVIFFLKIDSLFNPYKNKLFKLFHLQHSIEKTH